MASSGRRWRSQHVLHRLGEVGVLLASLLFVVGFSVPHWASFFGLWLSCSSKACSSNLYTNTGGWMMAVRVTECIALLAYVLCCIVVILENWFQYCILSPFNRLAEILGIATGITSIAGAIVFGVCWKSNKIVFASPGTTQPQDNQGLGLQWGFGLVITASIIILLSAVAISFSRHKHERSKFSSKYITKSKTDGGILFDDGITFQHFQSPDCSSMMLVPASHFDSSKPVTRQTSDPPPYALPPPYPYRSTRDVFLPIASSSPLAAHISDTTSMGGLSQGTSAAIHGTDRALATPSQTFITSPPAFCMQSQPRVMQPLFIKTSDGGSEIEITPSAQNSSGLPSPFNRF